MTTPRDIMRRAIEAAASEIPSGEITATEMMENLAHAARQRTWQPIETAPRETDILGCWRKSGVMGVVICLAGEWEENDQIVSPPSHWMPLPEPPK